MTHHFLHRSSKIAIIGSLLAVFLSGCAQLLPAPGEEESAEIVVRKSPNDEREYRYLVLPNKLRVLLVSDPTTQKSAAALSVYRGSFHEPLERPGLAHFLEHMLFIQTHTYPEIDGFQHHISGNGGSSNAYTALDHTNYFFDISPQAFPEALDRFAHFFIDPVLAPEYADREKNAVNSEYQMQLKDDGWRGYMVGKQALNPAHPGSRFTIGSLETLKGDIQLDLVDFFETEYSADQMGLVVLSNDTLDTLEDQIAPLFGMIKNNNIGPDYPDVPIYTKDQLPATVSFQTQKEGTLLTYNFPLPNTRQHYKKKPELYFSNLIGHEGEGSLYQLLNKQGYVESLAASVGEFDRNNSMLSVQIELTPQGEEHQAEITDLLFQYIDLLKNTPPQQWLYDEQAVVAELGFRFQEKSNPMGFVYSMAPRLDEFPPEDLLVAPYLMEEFDPDLIQEYLRYVTPNNMLVEIAGPKVKGAQVEPWFQVPYSLERQQFASAKVETDALAIPPANPYLPEQLELVESDNQGIIEVIDIPGISIWQDTEVRFGAPRANLFLEFAVQDGLVTPAERAMSQVYRMLVEDGLSELVYPAYLAGLGYSIGVSDAGYEINIGGYEDKQLRLLEKLIDALLNTSIDPAKFAQFKASIIRDWRNSTKDRPFSQAFTALTDTLRTGRWPRTMLIDALAPITAADLATWRDQRITAFTVKGMVHGNVDASTTESLLDVLSESLKIQTHDIVRADVREVNESLRLEVPVDHNDAAIVLHLQDPDDALSSRAKSSLASQLLHNAYFSDLRTNQQLGYVVSVTNRPVVNRGGISFVVQSPVKGPGGLEEATRTFFNNYVADWMNTDDIIFQQQKAGLINRLLEPPKNLNEQSQRYWADLRRGYDTFDSREQIASLVEALTKQDMQKYFESLLAQMDSNRLIIYTMGKFEDEPEVGEKLASPVADWG
ncbi:MAG: insulinase family protein [Pseudomonadota bacterium]